MKTTEYTSNELKNIKTMFDSRKLYTLRDKSENQQFEDGDLCILRFKSKESVYYKNIGNYGEKTVTNTLIVTFVSETRHDGYYIEYTLRELNGYQFNIADYESGFSLYHLEIPRDLYETVWMKFNKKEEAKRLAQKMEERERRRIFMEEEAKKKEEELLRQKQYEEEAAKRLQMEKERRSQTMEITVGEYEDILSQLSDLASRVEYIEDNMAYRYCSEDE